MQETALGVLNVARFTPTPVGNASGIYRWQAAQPVHPHARGECVTHEIALNPASGSPPRPWGMPHRQALPPKYDRFTPTPVGNAVRSRLFPFLATVHPHARGECTVPCTPGCCCCGSPPRPWGMLQVAPPLVGFQRFTPTPVGNADRHQARHGIAAVHPHARGECRLDCGKAGCNSGSPPRPWGMRIEVVFALAEARFTPTPVGNASAPRHWPAIPSVHPHARGECAASVAEPVEAAGSPPRPWGMLDFHLHAPQMRRFTPTPVGNAPVPGACWLRLAVHPHARGECKNGNRVIESIAGSPPRPWGMLSGSVVVIRYCRFTPTPVGNAWQADVSSQVTAVHPHARGECGNLRNLALMLAGSPPRPWGMPVIWS